MHGPALGVRGPGGDRLLGLRSGATPEDRRRCGNPRALGAWPRRWLVCLDLLLALLRLVGHGVKEVWALSHGREGGFVQGITSMWSVDGEVFGLGAAWTLARPRLARWRWPSASCR